MKSTVYLSLVSERAVSKPVSAHFTLRQEGAWLVWPLSSLPHTINAKFVLFCGVIDSQYIESEFYLVEALSEGLSFVWMLIPHLGIRLQWLSLD